MKESILSNSGVAASVPLQSQTNSPDHILVVEDNIFIRRLNLEVLARSGYDVDTAEDGEDAWWALNTSSYDLLITDNQMPKVSGVELLKKLRAARMDLPVIMATGTSTKEEFARYPWPPTRRDVAQALYPRGHVENREKGPARNRWQRRRIPTDDMNYQKASQSEAPAGAPRQRPAHSAPRILVVDEDRDLRQLYSEALAGQGYDVDAAEDGITAWKALKTNRYHLMITEHAIPNLTGVELVKMLRAAHMAVPVVMAAGRLPTHELARNPALQFAATLSKPFAVGALVDTVNNVLRATDTPPEPTEPLQAWRQPTGDGLWVC